MRQNQMYDERLDEKRIKLISFISFLLGFAQAVLAYILSTYFMRISGTENVGLFYLISYALVLPILLNLHRVVRRIGKSQVFFFCSLSKVVIIFGLVLFRPSWFSALIMMIYIILGSVEWVAIDVILESFSKDRFSGRIRGLHLTIYNAGFLLGPLLATRILDVYDYNGVFTFMLFFNALVFIFGLVGLRNVNHRFDQNLGVLDILKKMANNKNILNIYLVSLTLEFFFALMVIYVPLYLRDIGFTWTENGIIFTIMLIPFVLLQYPAGALADKKMGEKEIIISSLLIMAVSTALLFFTQSKMIFVWAGILFATRIGASLVEVMRDSYFYKQIDGHDVDLINFFRTSLPVGYILATAVSSLLLLGFETKYVFLAILVMLLSALYPAFKLRDTVCESEYEEKKLNSKFPA